MSASGQQVLEREVRSVDRRDEESKAVGLPAACRRLDISTRQGRRLIAAGRFPVPELPRLSARAHHKFSTADIDAYLERAATSDVRRRG